MKGFSYSRVVSMLSYYLWRYLMEVALECVLEAEGERSAV